MKKGTTHRQAVKMNKKKTQTNPSWPMFHEIEVSTCKKRKAINMDSSRNLFLAFTSTISTIKVDL